MKTKCPVNGQGKCSYDRILLSHKKIAWMAIIDIWLHAKGQSEGPRFVQILFIYNVQKRQIHGDNNELNAN